MGAHIRGTLLVDDGVVLKLSDGKVVTISKVSFNSLILQTCLQNLLWSGRFTLLQQANGMFLPLILRVADWKADYIVKASADDKKADIQGWVSGNNCRNNLQGCQTSWLQEKSTVSLRLY